eukprot:s240_g20.t1
MEPEKKEDEENENNGEKENEENEAKEEEQAEEEEQPLEKTVSKVLKNQLPKQRQRQEANPRLLGNAGRQSQLQKLAETFDKSYSKDAQTTFPRAIMLYHYFHGDADAFNQALASGDITEVNQGGKAMYSEAHTRLALVERRWQAVEVYMVDLGLIDRELLADALGPAHLEGHQSFEGVLRQRAAARNAITAAEVDHKLRRSLLRKYQRQQGPLTLGWHRWTSSCTAGLKSRGVTRFLDLGRLNRRNIDNVENDEEGMQDDAPDDGDDGGDFPEPPSTRRRADDHPGLDLDLHPRDQSGMDLMPVPPHDPADVDLQSAGGRSVGYSPSVALDDDAGAPPPQVIQVPDDDDPPMLIDADESEPSDGPPHPDTPMVHLTDYCKAGCVIRHHVRPRRGLFKIKDITDVPIDSELLDANRTTVVRTADGKLQVINDLGAEQRFLESEWSGCTIFQISGKAHRELGMYASLPSKRVGKDVKVKIAKQHKKIANNAINERTLTPDQRAQFQEAKCKEFQPFFENQVWEFDTEANAVPERTLTARAPTKRAKNQDGTPRAKARLIVRGYLDVDALDKLRAFKPEVQLLPGHRETF